MAPYVQYLEAAYRDWSKTQHYGSWKSRGKCYSWLCSWRAVQPPQSEPAVRMPWASPRRNHRRAGQPLPGPQRPGGAPIGLFLSPQETPPFEISLLGAESAALTHGRSLGFSCGLSHRPQAGLSTEAGGFRSILKKTRTAMIRQFEGRFSQVHIIENSLDWARSCS